MINLVKSTFYKEKETKKKLIQFISKADYLSFGKECLKFEESFAQYQGTKHCVFVNSGSSANLALIQALLNLGKIKKGDYVGFSALTWSTNVMPLLELGLSAVPIDVELDTLNVSSEKIEDILNKYDLNWLQFHKIKSQFLLTPNIINYFKYVWMFIYLCRDPLSKFFLFREFKSIVKSFLLLFMKNRK